MKDYWYIYDTSYEEVEGGLLSFDTIDEAANYIRHQLPSDDYPYMIGTVDGIEAIFFQGRLYR